MSLLVHAYGAIAAIVDDQHDGPSLGLQRGPKLLAVHLEITIASKTDHAALWILNLRGNCRWQAIAYGARLRRKQPLVLRKLHKFIGPNGEISCAIGDDGICGQHCLDSACDHAHINRARLGLGGLRGLKSCTR